MIAPVNERFLIISLLLFSFSSLVLAQIDTPEKLNHTANRTPEVELLFCKGQSLLPVLLTTGQIDGYVAWQPYLALAEKSGIGKTVAYSRDFPPDGLWHNHPCCVLVASNDVLQNHPDTAVAVSVILLAGEIWAKENPDALAEITTNWLMGDQNYTFGSDTFSPTGLFGSSLSTSVFASQANLEWNDSAQLLFERMGDILNTIDSDPHNGSLNDFSKFKDSGPYSKAVDWIRFNDPAFSHRLGSVKSHIRIGYLMIDHQAPLYAAVVNWMYLQKEYGIALKSDESVKRPRYLELIIGGKKMADVELISAPTGQNLMTMMEQDNLDMAIVGITPAIGSMCLGCKAKIIQPVQNEGSGLVMATGSKVNDWDDFVSLAKASYAKGQPLKIGDPDLGTIADVIFQEALNASGLRGVRESGT
ncbi:NMT1-like family protein [uncultured archaeon]|nr:NMT1-like family protein [uncultured archaeon]